MSVEFTKKRLTAYCSTAAAMASASIANADIIYSGLQDISINQGNSLQLDLNNDTNLDVKLKNYVFVGGNYLGATVNFAPGQLAGFRAGPNNFAYVSNLVTGAPVGPGTVGPSFYGSMAYGAANPNAQFNLDSDGLIGLSFPAGADTLFGWIRVATDQGGGSFKVVDWAYESTPLTAIPAGVVPEPASLGLLAVGAAGLAAYRGKRRA
jgi:hypothetical protein